MRCDCCDSRAMFVAYLHDEARFLCERHIENYDEASFEQVEESRLVRSALDEAERILSSLLSGRVVKFVHLRYPEIHWAVWDKERECFIEKVVNSLTGEVLPLFRFEKLQDYFECVGKAIASGWIAVVTNIQPGEITGKEVKRDDYARRDGTLNQVT